MKLLIVFLSITKKHGEQTKRKIRERINNIPDHKLLFEPKEKFQKAYSKSWLFLNAKLNAFEFKVAFELTLLAERYTNSLRPLNDETTINELASILNISRNKVTPTLKKLFDLGVYAKFEVVKPDVPYTKYWILNPYLSFNGKTIDMGIKKLFEGTIIEQEFHKK